MVVKKTHLRILGIDPGVTTGLASLNHRILSAQEAVGQSSQHRHETTGWKRSQMKGEGDGSHHRALWAYLTESEPDIIVMERFEYQRRDKVILTSLEYIGIVRLYCEATGRPYKMQTPSQAKNLWTQDKMEALGLWLPSQPHAMDATRHVLYYVTVDLNDRSYINRLRPAPTKNPDAVALAKLRWQDKKL